MSEIKRGSGEAEKARDATPSRCAAPLELEFWLRLCDRPKTVGGRALNRSFLLEYGRRIGRSVSVRALHPDG
jgi:hypothetical protein